MAIFDVFKALASMSVRCGNMFVSLVIARVERHADMLESYEIVSMVLSAH